jgi:hypothetical protein
MVENREPLGGDVKPNLKRWKLLSGLLAAAGAVTFLVSLSGSLAQRAWQAYLINFVFWSGLSLGAVLFVAVLNLTQARWGRPLKRMAESLGAYSAVSFFLFWVLYFGRDKIFPWIHEPVPGKESWLNIPFLFARDGVGLFLITAVALALLYFSVRADRDGMQEKDGWRWRYQVILSPILGILYALVLTLVALDLIMSLDPHWYSTLFGGYYFIGSFYVSLAALAFLTTLTWRRLGLDRFIQPRHFHDLGKLLLAFCLMTGYLFYTQFLVIWYGNLPEETRYVILRVRQRPWEPIAWVVLVTCFVLPFVLLLSRRVKMKPGSLMILSGMILVGMWLERFLLVAPSLWKDPALPLGYPEIPVSLGFLGLMMLSIVIFLERSPLLPVSDPLFKEGVEEVKTLETEVAE